MGQDRDNAIHATDDLVASKLSEGAPCYHIVWFDWFGLVEGRSKNLASSVVADFSSHAMKEADKGTPYTRSVLSIKFRGYSAFIAENVGAPLLCFHFLLCFFSHYRSAVCPFQHC
jgi:hypothetical protein